MSESMNPYSILLIGHTLKYEVECICKIFMPVRKFVFYYEKEMFPKDVSEFAVLEMIQLENQTQFKVIVTYQGRTLQKQKVVAKCEPIESKSTCEYYFTSMLYQILSDITGMQSSWGLLTGIRPVKLLQPLLRNGKNKEEIKHVLSEKYWISSEKLDLIYHTAVTQEPLLKQTPAHSVSLYISIPFCPTRCSYCSFVSHSVEQAHQLIPSYLDCLCKELEIWGELVKKFGFTIDTVYFGGGTPTSISAGQLDNILSSVEANFDLSQLREYCVEAGRPDTITWEKLMVLKKHRVNRISVNPQTMQDHILKRIGRRHDTNQTVQAFQMARACGFQNINMDLIAGLPDDTPSGFHDTLNQIMLLQPDSITVHALTLKRAANLFVNGKEQIDNPVAQMIEESIQRLPQSGYVPYYMYRQKNTIDNQENVGYAKKGKESLYNILIMDESQSIIGAGCGASTKIVEPCGRITRIHNYKFPYEYIQQFDQLMKKKEQAKEIFEKMV